MNIDASLVDWSRAQFALTAMYHWFFVPLTLGLGFMLAFMETIYVKTGDQEWKHITKFWQKLFGINFAIGVATGLILEFQFGTNWSNYSWFVRDIFGAPLAIEGIMAFFLESTFIAVMFFGWNKVSKKFHLLSTWLVAFGASLSALWILVANAWMQYPIGMKFNPITARSEMYNFGDVLLSPVAVNKFLHTVFSCYVISSLFVLCVSSWLLLKKREELFAKKSIVIAATFGLISSIFLAFTGDGSAYQIAQKQPAKLAVMEGLYNGKKNAGLVAFGILNPKKQLDNNEKEFIFKIEIPKLLSLLSYRKADAFVPGINDLISGNEKAPDIIPASEKIKEGKIAIEALTAYKKAIKENNTLMADSLLKVFNDKYKYFGYGHLNHPKDIIPKNIALIFYSFHIMVALGIWFILLFTIVLIITFIGKYGKNKLLLWLAMLSFPLGILSSQLGWVVSEVGRQPWIVQDLMPTFIAPSKLNSSYVVLTFSLFAILFTILLIVEIKIMITQIKKGPERSI